MFKFDQGTERETQLFRVSRAEGQSMTTLDLILITPALAHIWNDRETVCAIEIAWP